MDKPAHISHLIQALSPHKLEDGRLWETNKYCWNICDHSAANRKSTRLVKGVEASEEGALDVNELRAVSESEQ